MTKAVDIVWNWSLYTPDVFKNIGSYKTKYGPGQIVTKVMSAENRAELKNLRAEDLNNIRPDLVFCLSPKECEAIQFRSENRKLLLKFDREVLGHV